MVELGAARRMYQRRRTGVRAADGPIWERRRPKGGGGGGLDPIFLYVTIKVVCTVLILDLSSYRRVEYSRVVKIVTS
jgi:hypothetical protein